MSNFFAIPITDEWGTTYQLTTAGYTTLVVLMLALLLLACFIGNSVKQPKFSARQLAFSAMAIAAAFVTSEIKRLHHFIFHAVLSPDRLLVRSACRTDDRHRLRLFTAGQRSVYHQHTADAR